MADRPKALRRLVTVQAQMVRLNEWRLSQAEQTCRDIESSQARLRCYFVDERAPGATLARAALRSLHALDRRLAEADRQRRASEEVLKGVRQRENALTKIAVRAEREARRTAEDRELAATIEFWLAAGGASLP